MTIREIARHAKVSRSTVSAALRDHHSISLETRRRIKALADKLGYRPDPTIAKVMGAIARHSSDSATSPIILLTDWPVPAPWKKFNLGLKRFYDGMLARTTELGYRLDELWLRSRGMSPRRIEQILESRGIEGIAVLNYPEAPARLPLNLSSYASVVVGRALVQPRLYAIDHDHHQGLLECLNQVALRGYRRPGLILTHDAHERTMHCWAAAYQYFLSHLASRDRIPCLLINLTDAAEVKKWMRTYKPDVIIGADPALIELLESIGLKVPESIGFAALFWREDAPRAAGIDTQDEAQGARCIDLLIEQMRRNQHGVPNRPETILFDGFWRNGSTLPVRDTPQPQLITSTNSPRGSKKRIPSHP